MGTVLFIAVVAIVFFVLFKKYQRKRKHEILYQGRLTEEQIEVLQARERSVVGAKLGGAVGGAFMGSFVGIAALGGAIAGTIPGAILGWYLVRRNRGARSVPTPPVARQAVLPPQDDSKPTSDRTTLWGVVAAMLVFGGWHLMSRTEHQSSAKAVQREPTVTAVADNKKPHRVVTPAPSSSAVRPVHTGNSDRHERRKRSSASDARHCLSLVGSDAVARCAEGFR